MNAIPIMPLLEVLAGACLLYIGLYIDRTNKKRERYLDIETFFVIGGVLAMMDGGIKMISVP